VYRILSTKALLLLPESIKLLGDVSSGSSSYTSSAEGLVDAIAQRLDRAVDTLEPAHVSTRGIVNKTGDPLSQECRNLKVCNPGEGLLFQNGTASCTPCLEGQFSAGGSSAKCDPCPAGMIVGVSISHFAGSAFMKRPGKIVCD
jgi:hypothetical protein